MRPRTLSRLIRAAVAAGAVLALAGASGVSGVAEAAPDTMVTIVALDNDTKAPIPHFRWVINLDNSHDEASLENPASFSPVVATGDETNAVDVSLPDTVAPNRGYLVSVYANDGVGSPTTDDPDYKIGGKHFTLPADAGDVTVELQPNPLPLAALKARVFNDNAFTNSEWDVTLEDPPADVEDFHVIIEDVVGEVTTDWFGNPICTEYEDGNLNGFFDEGDYGPDGPIPIPGTGGFCHPGPDGIATIPNLGPNKYDVHVIPPDGTDYVQTSTLEGTFGMDAWVPEGNSGFASEPEEAAIGAQTWFGFIRPCTFGDTSPDDYCGPNNDATGTGTIKGCMYTNKLDTTETIFALGPPIPDLWVAVADATNNDALVWSGPGDADGCFEVPDVPDSTYLISLFDQSLDHIIKLTTVIIEDGGTIDMGGKIGSGGGRGVAPWFGKMVGSVYIDANENGIREPGETPIKGVDLDTRFKDGSVFSAAFTDNAGNYEFPEVFEWEHFFISEVGYGRFKQTGAAVYNTDLEDKPVDYPWANDCYNLDEGGDGYGPEDAIPGCTVGDPMRAGPTGTAECTADDDWKLCEHGPINQDLGLASLLQATFLSSGQTYYFDWGKNPFAAGENGGIVGITFNATTRNELNAQLQANEDYEPGIPNVPVSLYAPVLDGLGNPVYDADGSVMKDHLAAVYKDGIGTDSWYDDLLPTDCIPVSTFGRTITQVQPYPDIWDRCLELESILNQDKPGVFDGGYAFDVDCSNPDAADPFNPAELLPVEDCPPIGAGKWIVEVEPPTGFRSVMEEDINVFSGDTLVPAVPPPPCAGPVHTVHVVDDRSEALFDPDDPSNPAATGVYNPDFLATTSAVAPDGGSPYEGEEMPLCNARLVDLQPGQNANSDFFMFTDARYKGSPEPLTPSGGGIPVPGRIIGILLDDLAIDLDPNSANYAGKRGIPNTPVGIRDYSGKLITTLYTDAYGRFEVLLPSTGTYNCPLPAGPCPGMYYVVGNDPGDIDAPSENFNPNYQSLPLVFEVWPGLTTYADVAIIPTTNFVAVSTGGSQFQTPPVCTPDDVTPDLRSVSQPYGSVGDSFTINGTGFGASQGGGSATLDGVALTVGSWSDTSIDVTIPGTVSDGPHQLLVTRDNGNVIRSGMTIHVLGAGYNPPQIHVDDGAPAGGDGSAGSPYNSLQDALDASADGDLILVHPGTYFDRFIFYSNVKLQGYGTAGAGATILDGRFLAGVSGLDQEGWLAKVAGIPHDGASKVPWGQVITVIAEDGQFHSGYNPQIDGMKIAYGRNEHGNAQVSDPIQGGSVYAHGFARNLEISNNLITGSFGNRGGGVILGLPMDFGGIADAQNDDIRVHHNQILNNGGMTHAGAVALYNGAQNYRIDHNFICGNYSAEYGGGISNFGLNDGGKIQDNKVLFNYAFDEGGGIMVAGEQQGQPGQPGTGLSTGSGDIVVERNLVQGNVSNDDGGGIRLLNPVQWNVRIANNMIVNNLATDTGGGISLDDALDVEIVNNTIAKNISTATAEDADISCNAAESLATCPHGAGLTSDPHSEAVRDYQATSACTAAGVDCTSDFTNPVILNNIFWQNEAFYTNGATDLFGNGLPSAGYIDIEVPELDGEYMTAHNSICTSLTVGPDTSCLASNDNQAAVPGFISPVDTEFVATAFANDPSFIYINVLSTPGDPQGDYHLSSLASPAVDAGTPSFGGVSAPTDDFDGDLRGCPDQGADEAGGDPTCAPTPPTPALIQYMSFSGAGTIGGVAFDDEDVVGYKSTTSTWGMVFDGSDVGAGNGRDLAAFAMIDADSLLLSYQDPTTIPGVGAVDDSDIVQFEATSLGSTTAGTFNMYFDGSDVGLTAGSEAIDALELNGGGALLISTDGAVTANGVSGVGQDVLRFLPASGGVGDDSTAGTWSFRFDGDDVGLTAGGENIDALANGNGFFHLSTTGNFTVPRPPAGPAGDLSGADEDVFRCDVTGFGLNTTSCDWLSTLIFDGSTFGLPGGQDLDAYERRTGLLP